MRPWIGGAGLAAWLAVLLVASCADTPPGLLSGTPEAAREVREDCAFATQKCTHCHPIDRVVMTRGVGIARWQTYIDQMRRKPSSGISPSDANVIFRCLRFIEEACAECKRGRS